MNARTRTTISLPDETLEVFKRMAEAGNMSVSKCMGDWLSDTAEAAQLITLKMEEAKQAPLRVVQEMRSLVTDLHSSLVSEEKDVILRDRQRDLLESKGGARRRTATAGAPLGDQSELADDRLFVDRLMGVLAPPLTNGPGAVPPSSNTGGKSPSPTIRRAVKGGKK